MKNNLSKLVFYVACLMPFSCGAMEAVKDIGAQIEVLKREKALFLEQVDQLKALLNGRDEKYLEILNKITREEEIFVSKNDLNALINLFKDNILQSKEYIKEHISKENLVIIEKIIINSKELKDKIDDLTKLYKEKSGEKLEKHSVLTTQKLIIALTVFFTLIILYDFFYPSKLFKSNSQWPV